MEETQDGPRFWIDDNPEETPFRETYAVVDEEEGGVVAYFCDVALAEGYIALRRAS